MTRVKIPMITFVTCPKSFQDPFIAKIQENAILSWKHLASGTEIILFGDDEGVDVFCQLHNIKHIPHIQRNHRGTPFVHSIISQAQQVSTNDMVVYVNADIIFLDNFIECINEISEKIKNKMFLLVGQRWNLDSVTTHFEYGWQGRILQQVKSEGELVNFRAMDFFVFRKDFDFQFPPFYLGRNSWDSWFIYRARQVNTPVIDITHSITAIHQDHDYRHINIASRNTSLKHEEYRYNFYLLGFGRRYTIRDATHCYVDKKIIKRRSTSLWWVVGRLEEVRMWIGCLLEVGSPYTAFFLLLYKKIKTFLHKGASIILKHF